MALFKIVNESFLGASHCGDVTAEGAGTVELNDQEVETLVRLIREKKTTDVKEMNLPDLYPDLHEKLSDAYYQIAFAAVELHWLWHGYESGYFEYDKEELMNYCKEKCGFTFEYEESDYQDDEGDFDDDAFNEAESKAFNKWIDDYVYSLSDNEVRNFFFDHMNADLEMQDVDYKVEIPEEIVQLAMKAPSDSNL